MYELMIVSTIKGGEGLLSRVEKTLKDADASNLKIEKMGKRQLAYPIKKHAEAEYFLLNFDMEGSALKGISDMLRFEQEDVLRYLILTVKARKASKRKNVQKVEEVKVEEKEKPKVTVTTTISNKKPTSETQSKQVTSDKKVSKVSKGSKESKVKTVKKVASKKK